MTGEGWFQNICLVARLRKGRVAKGRLGSARGIVVLLTVAAALIAPWRGAAGQSGSVFRGQVVADSSFDPLPGAQVTIVELEKSVDSGSDGEFRFTDLPAGELTVRIRMVGYTPQSVRIRVDGRDSLVRDFLLKRIAPVLPNVAVTAKADARIPVNLIDFERRRLVGEGRFITPQQMERERGRKMSDVLRKVPGIYFHRLPGGSYAVGSSRGTMSIARRAQGICFATIVFDGIVISQDRPGTPPMPIDDIKSEEIAAVEYYPGGARMPPELNGSSSACGVLAFWTRIE
jgi:hypothetical protein